MQQNKSVVLIQCLNLLFLPRFLSLCIINLGLVYTDISVVLLLLNKVIDENAGYL